MNSYSNKKVLVTGAGGFIGSHLTEKLIDLGARVTGLIWYKEKENNNLTRDVAKEKLRKVNIHYGDLKDDRFLAGIMTGTDIVFHLAAINSVPYSLRNPREVFDNNINGAINLLLAAGNAGVKRVVLTSSAGVYAAQPGYPIAEHHKTDPANPYAASKLAAEEIARSLFQSLKLPVVILRPFNTFGPGQSEHAVIPNIILQALEKGKVNLGRIDSSRDFNYISNTVSGFTAAGITEHIEGEIFNIASGSEHFLQDVINNVEKLINKKLTIGIEDKRIRPGKSEADRLWASIKKAQEILNYRPAVSFGEGLKHTIQYYSRDISELNTDKLVIPTFPPI